MKELKCDIAILGAGPAGASAALCLSNQGYRVILLDKHEFPRDKICGDAMSPDVVKQLSKIRPSLAERFYKYAQKERITGLRIYSPSNATAEINLLSKDNPEGFVISREEFDNILIDEIKQNTDVTLFENTEITSVERSASGFTLESAEYSIECQLLIACDGVNSAVARKFAGHKMERKHHCGALRIYYENVEFETRDKIELHFIKDVLPGYFWVFPMANNKANVGIGMRSDYISKKKIKLKTVLEKVIQEHPTLAPRFANAKALETVKGMGIPIGSRRVKLSSDHLLIAGDAACLVDPISGEGIGNAIRSGRFAAQHAIEALKSQQFNAASLMAYDKKIYNLIGDELKFSMFLQWIMRNQFLANSLIHLMARSKKITRFISHLLEELNFFGDWAKWSFYKRLLFGNRGKG